MEIINKNTSKKGYKSIDCLKFILAIFVVGIHTSGPFGGTVVGLIIQLLIFTMAVPLFFAVSGYFLYLKILRHSGNETIWNYCKRLGKLYFIWSLLYIPHIITEYQKRQGWGMLENGAFVLIRNMLFCGSYNQLWYLVASIWGGSSIFSLKLLKDEKKTVVFCIIVCVIAMLFDSCAAVWPDCLKRIPILYQGYFISVRNGLLFGFPFMGIGIAAYRLRATKSSKALLMAILFFLYRTVALFFIKLYDGEMGTEIIPGTWGCTLFCLIWLLNVELPISDAVSGWLRKGSILIFLIHPYMIDVANAITDNSTFRFVLVVLFSTAFSSSIIALSRIRGFSWLRNLY